MADTITSSNSITIGFEYYDNDQSDTKTATMKISNPKSSIATKAQIQAAFTDSIFITGYDDYGNPQILNSDSVLTASTTAQTVRNLDIGWED